RQYSSARERLYSHDANARGVDAVARGGARAEAGAGGGRPGGQGAEVLRLDQGSARALRAADAVAVARAVEGGGRGVAQEAGQDALGLPHAREDGHAVGRRDGGG